MLRHVVVFTLNPDVTPERKAELAAGLNALVGKVPTLRAMTAGVDEGISDGAGDLCLVADFDDAAGWQAYQEHPDHVAAATPIREALIGRASSQFLIP